MTGFRRTPTSKILPFEFEKLFFPFWIFYPISDKPLIEFHCLFSCMFSFPFSNFERIRPWRSFFWKTLFIYKDNPSPSNIDIIFIRHPCLKISITFFTNVRNFYVNY